MDQEITCNNLPRGGKLPYRKKLRDEIRSNMTAGRLLEGTTFYKSIKNWFREFSKKTGSPKTKQSYAANLARFCYYMDLDPDEIVAKAIKEGYEIGKITWAENTTDDYFLYMETELGYARKTCSTHYGAVRGFFRSNGILFIKKTPRQWAEKRIQPPAKDDLVAIRNVAGPRGRCAMDMMNSLGWRRADIIKLTYGDIKVDYEKGLSRLYLTFRSQKEEVWAANFLGMEATDSLRLYLDGRVAAGEELVDSTPLLGQTLDSSKPLSPDMLSRLIRKLAEQAGRYLTPTHFRKRFRTIVEAIIGENPTKRMGGWKLSGVAEMYFLPPREETLKQYKQIEAAMSLTEQTFATENTAIEVLREMAIKMGIDPLKLRIAKDIGVDDGMALLLGEVTRKREEDSRLIEKLRSELRR